MDSKAYISKHINKEILLEQVRAKARQLLSKDDQLFLYGSRARGDNRIDSDWDFMLILKNKQPDHFEKLAYPIQEIGFQYNQYFSILTYSQEEWQKMSFMPFYKNVEHNKIQIV